MRRRVDSDAWHKTFKAESEKNKEEEECYRLAREAARKAREDFDLKHPKPIAAKAKATSKPKPAAAKTKATPKANAKCKAEKKLKKTQEDADAAEDDEAEHEDMVEDETSPPDID